MKSYLVYMYTFACSGGTGCDGVGGGVTGGEVLSGAAGLPDRVVIAVARSVGRLLLELGGRRGHRHCGGGRVVSVSRLGQVLHGGLAVEVRVACGEFIIQILIASL